MGYGTLFIIQKNIQVTLISIIVPNYNHAPFLKKRLESIFLQKFQDFEVILLDDASTDNSTSILDDYKNHPKTTFSSYNNANSGNTFSQWKKGIEKAKGKYIWLAESDDYASPDFLSTLVPILENDDALALAFCNSHCINEKEEPVLFQKFQADRWNKSYKKEGNKEIQDELIYHNSICNASAILFRSRYLKEVNLGELKYCGDWKAVIDVILNRSFYYCHSKLNHYRIHKNSVTFSERKSIEERVRFSEYIQLMEYGLKAIELPISLHRERHRWIVGEWMDKKDIIKSYYNPPFPFQLKIYFYSQLIKRLIPFN